MQKPFDPFRPRTPAAAAIYDAFQNEAAKRRSSPGLSWVELERTAVHRAACEQARLNGWPEPELQTIEAAERSAKGHIDYGMKWALYVVDSMRKAATPA